MRLSSRIPALTWLNGRLFGTILFGTIARSTLGLSALGLSVGLSVSSLALIGLSAEPAPAQTPTCQPPRENQFLLLVLNQKAETQTQLQQLLPANAVLTVCDYLSNNVVRVEGFSSAEIANAWAKYISDRAGLRAFVARSAASSTAAMTTTPALTSPAPAGGTRSAATPNRTYNPQPLGAGYAVLVNYFSKPEVASDVSQVTANAVGLAAYNQHPYLLAIHTTNEATAAALLKTLSDRGFTAVIVDSRRVMLLAPSVVGTGRS